MSLKRKSRENVQQMAARKRKSLLLQQSISLHIPIEDISQCSGLNCFVNVPDQVFSLTYLSENDTLNPESLQMLEVFSHRTWQAYIVGFLHNFSYQPAQRKSLETAINKGLKTNSKDMRTYRTKVSRCQALNPTENDCEALKIAIVGASEAEARQQVVYEGYLLSWCSTVKESLPFLPVLLCRGNAAYRDQVNNILAHKFDVDIKKLLLTEEELKHLSTYCLIMLDENDSVPVTFHYKIQSGDVIKLAMSVEPLLRLWKRIHQDDNVDIELDEVILYHEALDKFYESTFGIKIGSANIQMITVNKCFSLHQNSKMWFKTTKVIHVVLKYLNHLAIKRLRIKTMNNYFDQGNVDEADASMMNH